VFRHPEIQIIGLTNVKRRLDLLYGSRHQLLIKSEGDKFLVQLLNFDTPLPIDIMTDAGTSRLIVDKKGITVTSKTMIQVDPRFFYLKKITLE